MEVKSAGPCADLPDDIWVQIWSYLPFSERRQNIQLVCKRWATAAGVSSDLWRSCEVSASQQKHLDYFKVMQWFGRHGPAVHNLRISLHRPGAEPPDNVYEWSGFKAGASALLAQLPNIQHLHLSDCHDFFQPQLNMPALQHLRCLQSLNLRMHSEGSSLRANLLPLTHLPLLTSLKLAVLADDLEFLDVQGLVGLTQLKDLRLNNLDSANYDAPGDIAVKRALGRLTNLTHLSLVGLLQSIPCEISKLVMLQVLKLRNFPDSGTDSTGYEHWVSLVMPASLSCCTCLRHLTLGDVPVETDWHGLCQSLLSLSSLRSLALRDMDLEHVLPDDWALSTRLTGIKLNDCTITSMPAAMRDLPGLIALQSVCSLRDEQLPRGAYLRKLQHLWLASQSIDSGPPGGPFEALNEAECLQVVWFRLPRYMLEGSQGETEAHPGIVDNCLRGLREVVPAGCKVCALGPECHGPRKFLGY